MDSDHLKPGYNQIQDSNKLQFLIILEPDYWNIAQLLMLWKAAEEQLPAFYEIFNYKIYVNVYRDFLENFLQNS